MNTEKEFKPYIPAEKVTPELTIKSIIMGVLLAIIFGAANAYLGLKVGMTVSASIPAAVISMGFFRIIRGGSILESNVSQTIGSAGESLAAGAIFTLPVLFIWANDPNMNMSTPSIIEITLITLFGGLLGVFFMIPLRNALIVKEHATLPYPEGTACAEVLLAGEKGGSSAVSVFAGMGIAAAFKFVIDGVKAIPGEISVKIKGYSTEFGTQIYPAVFSVGYICGPRIASYMFGGGVLAWLVIIPMIVLFGGDSVIAPATKTISEVFAEGGASGIWSQYVRYIGAGALAAGGIISLIKSLPLIVRTFRDAMKSMFGAKVGDTTARTAKELNFGIVLIVIAVITVLIWLVPAIPVSFLGAVIIVVFGFFFATVSSRMVGLVGSSNNPVSGMAIATLIVATVILKATGSDNVMTGAIAIGAVICIVAAISGDTSQDLKTGFILGATPLKQQIGEVIGVVASSLTIGGTLYLLDKVWGFGSAEIAAPQAGVMKIVVEGIANNNLPWGLIIFGVCIAIVVEVIGIPVLPFAIGVYLPVHLNACIMVGGLVRLFFEKRKKNEENKKEIINDGILYCSGMIAGEGLVGMLLAFLTLIGVHTYVDASGVVSKATSATANLLGINHDAFASAVSVILGLVTFALSILIMFKFTIWRRAKKNGETKES